MAESPEFWVDGSPPGSAVPGILQARPGHGYVTTNCSLCLLAPDPRSCPRLASLLLSLSTAAPQGPVSWHAGSEDCFLLLLLEAGVQRCSKGPLPDHAGDSTLL